MCTLVAIQRPDRPLVVAANRDEFYDRAASGPRIVHAHPRAVAGVDLARGGTWMGANERGLFVAITNQRSFEGADPRLASRGAVVLEALREESVAGIDRLLGALDPADYNGFNLLYGDASALRVAYARPEQTEIEIEALGPGVWVLPNDRIGSADFPKTERVHALVAPWLDADAPLEEALTRVLADHELPPLERIPPPPAGSRFDHAILQRLQAICIHTPVYGTRSAAVLTLEPGRVARYLHAEGPPCTTPFVDVTSLFS